MLYGFDFFICNHHPSACDEEFGGCWTFFILLALCIYSLPLLLGSSVTFMPWLSLPLQTNLDVFPLTSGWRVFTGSSALWCPLADVVQHLSLPRLLPPLLTVHPVMEGDVIHVAFRCLCLQMKPAVSRYPWVEKPKCNFISESQWKGMISIWDENRELLRSFTLNCNSRL